jgi:hypothetical protein
MLGRSIYDTEYQLNTLASAFSHARNFFNGLLDVVEKSLELKNDIKKIIAEYRCQAMQLVNPGWEPKSRPEKAACAGPPL